MPFRSRIFVLLLSTTAIASAQYPVYADPPRCGGTRQAEIRIKQSEPRVPSPRAFAVGLSGFCSQYATRGWERPMNLYLGENAKEWEPYVRMAA